MPLYSVQIPISGYIYKQVEADSEEAAIKAAMQLEAVGDDIEEWETHEHITNGNVCNAVLHSATADLIE